MDTYSMDASLPTLDSFPSLIDSLTALVNQNRVPVKNDFIANNNMQLKNDIAQIFICEICSKDKPFSSRNKYLLHLETHKHKHKQAFVDNQICELCNQEPKETDFLSVKELTFSCDICDPDHAYSSKRKYTLHLETHKHRHQVCLSQSLPCLECGADGLTEGGGEIGFDASTLVCPVCDPEKPYSSKRKLLLHLDTHKHKHTIAQFSGETCAECNEVPAPDGPDSIPTNKICAICQTPPFSSKRKLALHLETHKHKHQQALLANEPCPICQQNPNNSSVDPGQNLTCEVCCITTPFSSNSKFQNHLNTHKHKHRVAMINGIACEMCSAIPKNFMTTSSGTDQSESELFESRICALCDPSIKFPTQDKLKRHLLTHGHIHKFAETTGLACSICQKLNATEDEVYSEGFICECGSSDCELCSNRSYLMCIGENWYKCTACNYKLYGAGNGNAYITDKLKRHIASQTHIKNINNNSTKPCPTNCPNENTPNSHTTINSDFSEFPSLLTSFFNSIAETELDENANGLNNGLNNSCLKIESEEEDSDPITSPKNDDSIDDNFTTSTSIKTESSILAQLMSQIESSEKNITINSPIPTKYTCTNDPIDFSQEKTFTQISNEFRGSSSPQSSLSIPSLSIPTITSSARKLTNGKIYCEICELETTDNILLHLTSHKHLHIQCVELGFDCAICQKSVISEELCDLVLCSCKVCKMKKKKSDEPPVKKTKSS